MAREQLTIGGCPQCGSAKLTCKYNRFESEDLRIDSWEHRCPDCGHRDTSAFRSDDDEDETEAEEALEEQADENSMPENPMPQGSVTEGSGREGAAKEGLSNPSVCPYCARTAGV